MYSVVLATVLTTGGAAPDCWFGGCYNPCYSTCHGCYGCSGCYGCYGCSGCYGSCSGWGCYSSCYGNSCWGTCSGYYASCMGCYGANSSFYGGCAGCYGSWSPYAATPGYGVPMGPVVVPPGTPPEMKKVPMETRTGTAPASVVIKAPAEVKLQVNGQPTPVIGTEQRFGTPPLEIGRTYSYEMVATTMRDGKEVTQTRKVIVRAGEESRVDFSDLVASPANTNGKALATR